MKFQRKSICQPSVPKLSIKEMKKNNMSLKIFLLINDKLNFIAKQICEIVKTI